MSPPELRELSYSMYSLESLIASEDLVNTPNLSKFLRQNGFTL